MPLVNIHWLKENDKYHFVEFLLLQLVKFVSEPFQNFQFQKLSFPSCQLNPRHFNPAQGLVTRAPRSPLPMSSAEM